MADRTMALVRAAAAHAPGITPVYAHTLMAACPHPRNVGMYARMIVDAADHRTIAVHAIRLGQVAAADRDRDGLADTLTHHQALHTALDDLTRRWGEPRHTHTPGPARIVPPQPPCPRDLIEKQALVAALIADPAPLPDISRRLLPGDFADRAHAALYRSVAALVHRGEAVDRITVLWEAQRRGHLTDGSLTTELALSIGSSGVPGSTDYWARRVLRTATTSAHAVHALAHNQALPAVLLIATTREALRPLDTIRHRWHTATRPPGTGKPLGTTKEAAAATAAAAHSRTSTATYPPPFPPAPTGPTAARPPAGRRP